MPSEKKVRDLMIPITEYTTIFEEATVKEAVEALTKSFSRRESGDYVGHRSVLVLDKDNRAVGLLTFRDLIKAVEPNFSIDPSKIPGGSLVYDTGVPAAWNGYFTQRTQQEARRKVREVMRPLKLITVAADAPLLHAIHTMVHHDIGSLPVIENDTVVGMIRINEIFMTIANTVTDG